MEQIKHTHPLINKILQTIPVKTALWLQRIENCATFPLFYEGDDFAWSLLEGEPTLTVNYKKNDTIFKLWWNKKLADNEIEVLTNIKFEIDDLAALTAIEHRIYNELELAEKLKN